MDDRYRIAIRGMRDRQQLDIAEMAGRDQDATPIGHLAGALEKFVALVLDVARDVFRRHVSDVSPFAGHPSPIAIHPLQERGPLAVWHFRKGYFEILETNRPINAIEITNNRANSRAGSYRLLQRK